MTSSSIDALLKVAAPSVKPSTQNGPRDSGDEFENYLRQAASSSPVPEKPRETASEKVSDKQISVSEQGEGATASPDDESAETPVVEQAAENIEEELEPTPVDEVLLSVAATALIPVAPAEAVADVEVAVEEALVEAVLITGDAIPSEGERPLPSNPLVPEVETESAAREQLPEVQTGEALPITTEAEVEQVVSDASDQKSVVKEAEVSTDAVTRRARGTAAVETTAKPPAEVVEASVAQTVVADEELAREEIADAKKIEKVEKSTTKTTDAETKPTLENIFEIPQPEVAESNAATTLNEQSSETQAKLTVDAPAPAPTTVNSQAGSQSAIPPTNSLTVNSETFTTRGESEPQTPTVDRARFVQRVANAFRSAQQSDGPIQMRLSPPELGSLRIEIAVRNGVLSANLEAETPDARRLLLDNLPALRQRLAEQEIRIDKFEVDIRREGGQSDGQANAREQQSEQQASRASAQNRLRPAAAVEVLATRVPRSASTSADVGLDVRI